jgi:hypothetical protein
MTDRELLRDHELRGLIRPYPTRPTSIAGAIQSNPATWQPVTYMLYTPHKDGTETLHMCEAEDAGAFLVYRLASGKEQAQASSTANGPRQPNAIPYTPGTEERP